MLFFRGRTSTRFLPSTDATSHVLSIILCMGVGVVGIYSTSVVVAEDGDENGVDSRERQIAKADPPIALEGGLELASLDRARGAEETVSRAGRVLPPLFLISKPPVSTGAPAPLRGVRYSTISLVSIPIPDYFLENPWPETDDSAETSAEAWRHELDLTGNRYTYFVDGSLTPTEPSGYRVNVRYPYADDPRWPILRRLIQKVTFRQVRRLLKGELRRQYASDPTMGHREYLSRREEISQLGRAPEERSFDLELSNEVRNDVLAIDGDDEKAVVLIDWGPFQLDDTGHFAVKAHKIGDQNQGSLDQFVVAPEEDRAPRLPLFRDYYYKFDTDLKFRPKLNSLLHGEDYIEFLGKVAASVSWDFYTEVPHRKFFKAELETTIQPDGEVGFFVNFVIYSR